MSNMELKLNLDSLKALEDDDIKVDAIKFQKMIYRQLSTPMNLSLSTIQMNRSILVVLMTLTKRKGKM